ncbi:NADH dehydrogenase subunit 4L (mitochondrion) [Apis cerana]|uniref:NADH dehydrogenase subunit 4L n=3 Tax=Apis cerana TaxID=7461 RepID=A0A224AN79_APICC|nr:NADH dehydrogenase subunit 4L [Apis cerana]BAV58421.1 NADH dehydrogenase subunit 4L [Apis cerana japonica]BBA20998.1 NADH dehydrogenase subunit 4L [Apis cerana cerana]ACR55917.1 NADH dehydrogenase subunit 4L [Apis cerana]AIW06357.1 NADH dehydrogenase subunit 4L [Apis cerana]ARR27608.1 NADH dehydrogenase subunit 4L [Apis cerana]
MKLMFIMVLLFFIFLLYYNVNFLSFLILIEFMVITVLFYIIDNEINTWLFLIFLVFSVCELVLGLSLLVSMNYELGHQKLNMMDLIY